MIHYYEFNQIMDNKGAKIGCLIGVSFHLFLLSTIFMVGEGILFGVQVV